MGSGYFLTVPVNYQVINRRMWRGFRPLLIQLWGLQSLINGDGVLANYGAGRPWQLENGVAAFPPLPLPIIGLRRVASLSGIQYENLYSPYVPLPSSKTYVPLTKVAFSSPWTNDPFAASILAQLLHDSENYTRIITCTRTHTITIIIITNTRRQSDRNTTANDALIKHQIK